MKSKLIVIISGVEFINRDGIVKYKKYIPFNNIISIDQYSSFIEVAYTYKEYNQPHNKQIEKICGNNIKIFSALGLEIGTK